MSTSKSQLEYLIVSVFILSMIVVVAGTAWYAHTRMDARRTRIEMAESINLTPDFLIKSERVFRKIKTGHTALLYARKASLVAVTFAFVLCFFIFSRVQRRLKGFSPAAFGKLTASEGVLLAALILGCLFLFLGLAFFENAKKYTEETLPKLRVAVENRDFNVSAYELEKALDSSITSVLLISLGGTISGVGLTGMWLLTKKD